MTVRNVLCDSFQGLFDSVRDGITVEKVEFKHKPQWFEVGVTRDSEHRSFCIAVESLEIHDSKEIIRDYIIPVSKTFA